MKFLKRYLTFYMTSNLVYGAVIRGALIGFMFLLAVRHHTLAYYFFKRYAEYSFFSWMSEHNVTYQSQNLWLAAQTKRDFMLWPLHHTRHHKIYYYLLFIIIIIRYFKVPQFKNYSRSKALYNGNITNEKIMSIVIHKIIKCS